MRNPEVKNVREYLKGSKFFIKEHKNNFMKNSIITISYKVSDTKRMTQILMFNSDDFNSVTLKEKLEHALSSNDSEYAHWHQEYYEMNEVLNPLWKELREEEVL